MGAIVANAALADIDPLVANFVAQVLILAQITTPAVLCARGCWSASFSLGGTSSLQSELCERIVSITAAANELADQAASAVFGPATAPLAALTAVCITRGGDADLETKMQAVANLRLDAASRSTLQEIINHQVLRTVFQPIVSMRDSRLVGIEALSRGPVASAYERADQLFGAAAHCGLTHALEVACATQAMTYLERLPEPLWLSVNASAATLPDIYAMMLANHVDGSRVVLELTEHLPLGRVDELRPTLNGLRRLGTRIALDDTGCGYADLDAAASLEANLLKLCITVVGRIEHHEEVRTEIAAAIKQARSYGAQVLAEGVESSAQARILRELNIDLAQGWLYGRPFPAAELDQLSGSDFSVEAVERPG